MNRYPSPPLSAKWHTTASAGASPDGGHVHERKQDQKSNHGDECKSSMGPRQLPPLNSLRLPPPQSQSQYSLCHLALTPINVTNAAASRQSTKLPSPTSPHGQEQTPSLAQQVQQVQPQVQAPAQAIRPSPYPRPAVRSDSALSAHGKNGIQRQSTPIPVPIPNGRPRPPDVGRSRSSTDYGRPCRPPPNLANDYLSGSRAYIFKNISPESFGSTYDFDTMGFDAIGAQVSRQAANVAAAATAVANSTTKSVPTSTWCQCPRCKATRERQRVERRI